MKFNTLFGENFLTLYGAFKVNLKDQGLHLFQGINNADDSASSNGAGKSSIVDAICWCLFGTTAREVEGDKVVNLKAKKNTVVVLLIQNGASQYRVTRYRKHATGKNSLVVELMPTDPMNKPVDLSKGTDRETQKELEKIIGCSYDVFKAAVYSGQEAMPDLPRMKDRELKALIEEAAGLQRIERAYALARERANVIARKVETLKGQLERVNESKARTESGLEVRREKQNLWVLGRAETIKQHEERVESAQATTLKAVKAATDAKPAHDAAVARLAEISTKMAEVATLRRAADAATQAKGRAELAVEKHALQRANELVAEYKAKIANAEADLGKPCPECGTAGSLVDLDTYVSHQEAHLEKAEANVAAVTARVRGQLVALAAAKTALEAAIAAVPDVSALEAERSKLQAVVDDFKRLLTRAQNEAANNKAAQDALAMHKAMVNPEDAAVAEGEKRLADEVAAIAGLTSQIAETENELEIAQGVVKVFGPAGVRAQILDTVTPYLNSRTADYLSVLSDGDATAVWTTLTKMASGDLKEKFSIDVAHAKGGESFAALSGGEKRKVRLACALALQDLVASRATQPISLWIGDEVDDALDPSGLERLMTILERKARERGTVLVISHSDLRDWIDNVTTVTKHSEHLSTVEGSLCV